MRNYAEDDNTVPRTWLGLKEAGKKAYELGNFAEALNLYRTALRPEYECASTLDRQVLLSNIVACRLQMGGDAQASAALNDAQQCVDLNPQWPKGHVRLASVYSALGRSNDACNALQTALRLDPGNRTARDMLVRELRRERTTTTAPSNSATVDSSDAPPPPQNPNYVHPSSSTRQQQQQDHTAQEINVDEEWTLWDQWRFYQGRVMAWYDSQPNEFRNVVKAGLVFLVLYVAFGGRFGLKSLFSSDGKSGSSRPTQGNYGQGNAYEEFYRNRASNAYENTHRSSQSRYRNQDYDYTSTGGYTGGSSYYDGYSSSYSTSSWRESSLPSLALLAGIAYLCHLGGINPLHALMMMNVIGGRRHRRFGGGGGFYGGFGGFGRRRRPRHGAFF